MAVRPASSACRAEAPTLLRGARNPRRQCRPAQLSEGHRGPSSCKHSNRLAPGAARSGQLRAPFRLRA